MPGLRVVALAGGECQLRRLQRPMDPWPHGPMVRWSDDPRLDELLHPRLRGLPAQPMPGRNGPETAYLNRYHGSLRSPVISNPKQSGLLVAHVADLARSNWSLPKRLSKPKPGSIGARWQSGSPWQPAGLEVHQIAARSSRGMRPVHSFCARHSRGPLTPTLRFKAHLANLVPVPRLLFLQRRLTPNQVDICFRQAELALTVFSSFAMAASSFIMASTLQPSSRSRQMIFLPTSWRQLSTALLPGSSRLQ